MRRIGIISNPFTKINKQVPENNTILGTILSDLGRFEVTQTPEDLTRVCKEFQQEEIDLIGIVGGDGTVGLVLSEICKAYNPTQLPEILLLRGGTMNVTAANLGIYGTPKSILQSFNALNRSNLPLEQTPLYTLRVNNRVGFLFANGIASNFLSEFYKNKTNSVGAGIYLCKVIADGILNGRLNGKFKKIYKPELMSLAISRFCRSEFSPIECRDYSMIFASTIPKMPFGLHLFRKLNTFSPHAQIIGVALKGRRLILETLKILAGASFSSQDIYDEVFQKALIEVAPHSKYSLDGDIFEASDGKIEIELGPNFVFCSPYGKVT